MDEANLPALGLIGAGAWFAKEVSGPSVKVLGENLRFYLANRVSEIFATAAERAEKSESQIRPIAPGLLTRMIIDASFSEDDDDITEWWANLFLDASLVGSNHHAVFSDIMALLGPAEVKCLDDFINRAGSDRASGFGHDPVDFIDSSEWRFETVALDLISVEDPSLHYEQIVERLSTGFERWPVRATEWSLWKHDSGSGEAHLKGDLDQWSLERQLELSILQRAGLLRPLYATYSTFGANPWVRALGLTRLGYEFYRACKGLDRNTAC